MNMMISYQELVRTFLIFISFPVHHLARDTEGDTGKDDCHNDTDEYQW
ncbi:Uncharacterised protein [Enterobacter kobei]|nr:Uncharacterised protein [Enterobacter kobei]